MTTTMPSRATDAPPDARARRRTGSRAQSTLYHAVMILIVVSYIFPVAWAASMSLRTNEHMFEADQFIPHPLTFDHYANLFTILPDFWHYFGNTAIIVIFGAAGTLFSSALAGYGLARKSFPGSGVLLGLLLLTLMVPGQVTLIPQYVWFRDLGWIDTPLPIIVPLLFGTSIATFFFRQFYLTLPRELEDAAAVDGAGPFHTYFRVILPLSGPAFLAVGLLSFVQLWNSFYVNSIYLSSQDSWVVTQALQSLVGRYNSQYGEIMAGVTLVSVPVIVLYLIFQRWIVRGIAATGLAN